MKTIHPNTSEVLSGTVAFLAPGKAKVLSGDDAFLCDLDTVSAVEQKTRIAVGDSVSFVRIDNGRGLIRQCLPRRSALSRPDPANRHMERVMAANIDLAILVVSVKNPPLRQKLIDRFLIAAQHGDIETAILVNKIDALSSGQREKKLEKVVPYVKLGIPVLLCSAKTGEGIRELKQYLRGKASLLAGHSGVGKSSIVNALDPKLELRTQHTQKGNHKGRHTTSASSLYKVDGGIHIIDTPGFREFGLWDISAEELRRYFTEFEEFAAECRFNDCLHIPESGCGVKQAVHAGRIAAVRYESYLRIMRDIHPHIARGNVAVPDCAKRHDSSAGFTCMHCGQVAGREGSGTKHRNHCPNCLWSLHLDIKPGDRAAHCGGQMEPVTVWVRQGGEWAIIHRCRDCGGFASNRIAADDNEMLLMSLAVKPLAAPPFPLHNLDRS